MKIKKRLTAWAVTVGLVVSVVSGLGTVQAAEKDKTYEVKNAFMESAHEIYVNLSGTMEDVKRLEMEDAKGNKIPTEITWLSETSLKLTITDEVEINPSELYKIEDVNVQMRGILDDAKYYYEGDDLGLTYTSQNSTFKVWAPTASEVKLVLYKEASEKEADGQKTPMAPSENGVWSLTLEDDLQGQYYMYQLTFADGTTHYAVDPYAKAVSTNGTKGAIVDLEATNPEGFDAMAGPSVPYATDAIVYEMNVRDISIQEGNGFGGYSGKYLGLTQKGLKTKEGNAIGLDHLKELGITHVQLQPMYDYSTVDESHPQATYNWGYDPQNYNVPEGSYATNPNDPTCRIKEAKAMIQALHNEGIGVIMDVVYNHVYDVPSHSFEKVVPGYYFRTNEAGELTNGSGCNNEVASERPMVRKYIIDSTKYWAEEYGMDGFRFDLMALVDADTMKEVTKVLQDEVNPNIMIYGEPWMGGASSLDASLQMGKGAQKGTDIGIFNDNIRSAIKGDSDGDGTGFATGALDKEADVVEGVQGAIHTIATNPTEVVTYVTAHDNLNLWDKVLTTMHLSTEEPYSSLTEKDVLNHEAVKRTLLANGMVFTSQGIAFMHSGEEMLRTKFGVSNSYKSPDCINQVVWKDKDTYKAVFDYYQGLIALRKAHPAFRMTTAEEVKAHFEAYVQANQVVAFTLKNHANGDKWKNIVVIYNANQETQKVSLPEQTDWNIVVNDKKAGITPLETLSKAKEVEVPPLSMMVLYDEERQYDAIVTHIEVEEDEISLAVGEGKHLKVTAIDQNGADLMGQDFAYTSNHSDIVTVTDEGEIIANKEGKAQIEVRCGAVSKRIWVTVVQELVPTELIITKEQDFVYVSKTLKLAGVVYNQFGEEMPPSQINWTSSDPNIATVDAKGRVTGMKEGRVTITATVGELRAECSLEVKKYQKRYIIFEYIREDGDYTDWNLWTWNTGATDGQVDFVVGADGKATAKLEIGADTDSVGFIVRKGTDWSNCKQDIAADRFVKVDIADVVTEAKICANVEEIMITPLKDKGV